VTRRRAAQAARPPQGGNAMLGGITKTTSVSSAAPSTNGRARPPRKTGTAATTQPRNAISVLLSVGSLLIGKPPHGWLNA
jgi:hypothetical protein